MFPFWAGNVLIEMKKSKVSVKNLPMMVVRFKMVCFPNIGYFDEFMEYKTKMKN